MWEQGSGKGRGSFVRGGARPGKLLRSRMSSIQPAQITSIYRYPVKGLSSQPPPSVALARNSSSSTIASPSWRPISTKPAAIAILSCGGGRLSASAPTRLVGPATAALCELILEQLGTQNRLSRLSGGRPAGPSVWRRAPRRKLVEGEWINAHDNLALIDPTGVGKSWLAWRSATRHVGTTGQSSTSACLGCSRNWRWPAATVGIP